MNTTKNNCSSTDIAWEHLHAKLEQDGLLNNGGINTKKRFPGYFALATAAIVILLITALVMLIIPGKETLPGTVIYSNNEEQTISVTTLSDGSTIYMAQNSIISLSRQFSTGNRDLSLTGDAYFDVTNNNDSPFRVNTRTFTISVLGTSFLINYDKKGDPAVIVEKGKVIVMLKNTGEEKILAAGESTSIQNDSFKKCSLDSAKSFMQKTTRLHFKDQKLMDVARVLQNRYSDIFLELSPETQHRIITATFSGESLLAETQMICKALNLKYTMQNSTITIHE